MEKQMELPCRAMPDRSRLTGKNLRTFSMFGHRPISRSSGLFIMLKKDRVIAYCDSPLSTASVESVELAPEPIETELED